MLHWRNSSAKLWVDSVFTTTWCACFGNHWHEAVSMLFRQVIPALCEGNAYIPAGAHTDAAKNCPPVPSYFSTQLHRVIGTHYSQMWQVQLVCSLQSPVYAQVTWVISWTTQCSVEASVHSRWKWLMTMASLLLVRYHFYVSPLYTLCTHLKPKM